MAKSLKFYIKAFRQVFYGVAILVITALPARADEPLSFDKENPFSPSENATTDVDYTLAQALAEDKLALIIMGANWCHDSRALLKHFGDPDMAVILEQSYQTTLVDVGFLEQGKEIITRFGMPVIYGTPTVLIVDPQTGKLLNKGTMFQWRDAATIDLEDAQVYFRAMSTAASVAEEDISPGLAALYAEIDAFENAQAERIYGGFEILGPMMALGEDNEPEEFLDYWYEVRDLRYAITDDLARLRADAKARVEAGETDTNLEFPAYPAFTWE